MTAMAAAQNIENLAAAVRSSRPPTSGEVENLRIFQDSTSLVTCHRPCFLKDSHCS
jgi:hypothetical protein